MHNHKFRKTKISLILGTAMLAAAWMIGGPDVLQGFNWHPKLVNFLVFAPSVMVFFWSISGYNKFLACERRLFRKMLGYS